MFLPVSEFLITKDHLNRVFISYSNVILDLKTQNTKELGFSDPGDLSAYET